MILKELIKNLSYIQAVGNTNVEIKEIKTVSNQVVPNSLFVCIKGENVDSHNLVKDAYRYGAVAIITEKVLDIPMTQVVVKDSRSALSFIAREFYGCPDKSLKLIGITGTNGKTTTSHLIRSILENADFRCGVIGTIGVFYNDKFIEADLTTPDPLDLYRFLFLMKNEGINVVVMEVSAHALELRKTDGLTFDVGVFTNLTQDHLDYFSSMERYKQAKMQLFNQSKCKYIVANVDDDFGRELENTKKNVISYGIETPCDNFAVNIEQTSDKTYFVLNMFDKVYSLSTNLLGKFNIYNILAGATACALIGAPFDKIIEGVESFSGVEGRLEKVYDKDYKIFIDYAHTPDGLKNSIVTLKNICNGRLICVFGCGGNRDKDKRSMMGEISGKYADFTIITTDNPRFEEPYSIISQIEKGVYSVTNNFVSIEDRIEAIKYAIDKVEKNDIILVAGKGAEKYQDILGIKRLYNDKDTIRTAIDNR